MSDPYRTGSSTRVETKVSVVLIERTRKRWSSPHPKLGNGLGWPRLVGASVGILDESGFARITAAMRDRDLLRAPCTA